MRLKSWDKEHFSSLVGFFSLSGWVFYGTGMKEQRLLPSVNLSLQRLMIGVLIILCWAFLTVWNKPPKDKSRNDLFLRSVTLSSDTRPSITNLISSFQGFIILLLKTRAIIHTNFQFLIIRSQIKNVMALLECCSLETEKMVSKNYS